MLFAALPGSDQQHGVDGTSGFALPGRVSRPGGRNAGIFRLPRQSYIRSVQWRISMTNPQRISINDGFFFFFFFLFFPFAIHAEPNSTGWMEGTAQQTGNAVPGTDRIAPGWLGTLTQTSTFISFDFIWFQWCDEIITDYPLIILWLSAGRSRWAKVERSTARLRCVAATRGHCTGLQILLSVL